MPHLPRIPLILALLSLTVPTVPAVLQHGLVGIFEYQLQNWAGRQVLTDLGIALALVLAWMWRDARASGRRWWPWLLLTLAAGSFGPLLYLLLAPSSARGGAVR